MRIVKAYFGNGNFGDIKLSVEIERCAPNMETDVNKLDALLAKQRERFPQAIAVCDWSEGQITCYDTGKFTGIIWANRKKLTGVWENF